VSEDISKQADEYSRDRATVKLSKLHGYVSRIVKLILHKDIKGKLVLCFFEKNKKSLEISDYIITTTKVI
jgi:hypothetical protein